MKIQTQSDLVQSIVTVPVRGHHDLVATAETGIGKTMADISPKTVHILAQPVLRPGEGLVAIMPFPNRQVCPQICHAIYYLNMLAPCDLGQSCYDVHAKAVHRNKRHIPFKV